MNPKPDTKLEVKPPKRSGATGSPSYRGVTIVGLETATFR
jgi:hypothetical protein